MTYYIYTVSARLRSEIRYTMGSTVLVAIQDHIYHKNLGYFDAAASWETTEILELSELAHRLRKYAEGLDSTDQTKMEAMRLAKTIWNDFAAVYKVAMKRAGTEMVAA